MLFKYVCLCISEACRIPGLSLWAAVGLMKRYLWSHCFSPIIHGFKTMPPEELNFSPVFLQRSPFRTLPSSKQKLEKPPSVAQVSLPARTLHPHPSLAHRTGEQWTFESVWFWEGKAGRRMLPEVWRLKMKGSSFAGHLKILLSETRLSWKPREIKGTYYKLVASRK